MALVAAALSGCASVPDARSSDKAVSEWLARDYPTGLPFLDVRDKLKAQGLSPTRAAENGHFTHPIELWANLEEPWWAVPNDFVLQHSQWTTVTFRFDEEDRLASSKFERNFGAP